MSNVQTIQPIAKPETALATTSETGAILNLIERVARDPSVDMDKLVRLLELRDKTEARARADAFDAAMTAAQAEMRAVAADSNNPQTRSRYASYFALDKALRPIYTRHGFSLSFNTDAGASEGCIRILCRVSRGGHSRDYHIDMPADGKGAKGGDVMTKTHATGAAVSYGSRYLLKMIFNVAVGEGDDDGNSTGAGNEPISADQLEKLQARIVEVGVDIARFCAVMKVAKVEDTKAKDFKAAMNHLQEVEDWSSREGRKGA